LTISGRDAYIIRPHNPADFELLAEAVDRAILLTDLEIIVGVKGPIAGPEICNGLMVPLVEFDELFSLDRDSLIKSIPRPKRIRAKAFLSVAEALVDQIIGKTQNAGPTDEERALNYLAVRYPTIYANAAEAHSRGFFLETIEVLRSHSFREDRKIIDVVLTYTNRNTHRSEKFFVRVDVTEKFPFLVTNLSPYG
jgi:PatG C-terminal